MTNRFFTFRIDSSSRRGRVKKICVITKAIFVSDHCRHLFIISRFHVRIALRGWPWAGMVPVPRSDFTTEEGRPQQQQASHIDHSFGVTISPTKSMQSLEYVCTTHLFKALHTVHSVQVYSQYNFQTFTIYCFCYSDPHEIPNHLTFPLDLCT